MGEQKINWDREKWRWLFNADKAFGENFRFFFMHDVPIGLCIHYLYTPSGTTYLFYYVKVFQLTMMLPCPILS